MRLMTLHVKSTLNKFLERPEVKPYEEYLHEEIVSKTMPSFPHSLTQIELGRRLANWANEAGGYVLSEQRCVLHVRVVWIVDPIARNVTIYRPQLTPELASQFSRSHCCRDSD